MDNGGYIVIDICDYYYFVMSCESGGNLIFMPDSNYCFRCISLKWN